MDDDDNRLTVPVSPECSAHSVVFHGGRPGLVIDYGGYELAFMARAPEEAHDFAVGLAYAALCFASRCRHLMEGRRD